MCGVLTCGLAACATTVVGTASPAAAPVSASASAPAPSSAPASQPSASGGAGASNAAQVCSQVSADAAKQSFGLPDVTVTPGNATTLDGGIIQVTCGLTYADKFKINVVFQAFPLAVFASVNDFVQTAQQKFAGLQPLTVPNADAAGVWIQTVNGVQFDEVYAAKKQDADIAVVLTGLPQQANAKAGLIQFLTALAQN